ncbi:MAG: hypothetical protein JKY60_20175 [Kordiimonadaceae bacterium]|nr:hypothetical protein [Kordiimonadaceae bacterium]
MPQGTRLYIENRNTISVGDGSPTTIDVPVMPGIIHGNDWEYAEGGTLASRAVMEAAIEKVEIQVASNVFSTFLVPDLLKMNDFYGHNFVDGFLSQMFSQDYRQNAFDAERTAFVPGAHRAPKFRIFINAGRVSPSLKNHLIVEGVSDAGRNKIASMPDDTVRPLIRHEVETITLTDTGNVATIFKYEGRTEGIRSLNFEGANITGIVIKVNGVEKYAYKSLARLNELLMQSRAVANPQSDTWHINFELLGGSLDGVYRPQYGGFSPDDIEIEIYASDTTNVRLLSELYDKPKSRTQA